MSFYSDEYKTKFATKTKDLPRDMTILNTITQF